MSAKYDAVEPHHIMGQIPTQPLKRMEKIHTSQDEAVRLMDNIGLQNDRVNVDACFDMPMALTGRAPGNFAKKSLRKVDASPK